MNEFLEQFVTESRELAEQATADLLQLEVTPADRDLLDSAFRAFHTLKGGAGIVDFTAMLRAVHAAEDVLATIRAGSRPVSTGLVDDCLACIDQVNRWLDQIGASGELPTRADAAADALVDRLAPDTPVPLALAPALPAADSPPGGGSPMVRAILEEQVRLIAVESPTGRAARIVSAARVAANVLRHAGRSGDADRITAACPGGNDDGERLRTTIGDVLAGGAAAVPGGGPPVASRLLRVEASRIDELVDLTGEMIVAKNAIAHVAREAMAGEATVAAALRTEAARLDRLTASLQAAVLALRVMPLRSVFQRFGRVVREMSASLGKPTNLVIEGAETEADKAIVEMLFDPLLHVVRNALDHGIEPPAQRTAAGKHPIATLVLRAFRDGDQVVVEISDDGAGVDTARVRTVAAERGVAPLAEISAMADAEIVDLIFAPGFSTATVVSDLSGRGVGLDAVRNAVVRVGGSVAITSNSGRGSTVRFTLPFSVMITRVMTVEAAGQMFGIPLDAVLETVRVPRALLRPIGDANAFVLRDHTVPLIDLARLLGRSGKRSGTLEALAVVASVGGHVSALEVDGVGERMEVMLKPPGGLLAGNTSLAGTTLLGDGRVLLVLDLAHLLG